MMRQAVYHLLNLISITSELYQLSQQLRSSNNLFIQKERLLLELIMTTKTFFIPMESLRLLAKQQELILTVAPNNAFSKKTLNYLEKWVRFLSSLCTMKIQTMDS